MTLMLLAASMILAGACKDKSRISELKDFVEKTCKEGQAYTDEQWEKANDKFYELLEKTSGYEDITSEELHEIAVLQGRYAAAAFSLRSQKSMDELYREGDVMGILMEDPDATGDDSNETKE